MVTAHGTIAIAVEAMKKGAFDFVDLLILIRSFFW